MHKSTSAVFGMHETRHSQELQGGHARRQLRTKLEYKMAVPNSGISGDACIWVLAN